MLVLVLNTGSSSVKYQLIDVATGERLAAGKVEEVVDHADALREVVRRLESVDGEVEAVGHRAVHGGEQFADPTIVDDRMLAAMRSLSPLAPLHNPLNLLGMEIAREVWPDVPHVAVFDTAFHRTMPPRAYRYAVPGEWYTDLGVRRYGFHGTSHRVVAARAARELGLDPTVADLIVAHLGNGASMTAIAGGRSIDTSMGLSPLEGLVMGSRSGDVDPTVIGYVATATGRTHAAVLDALHHDAGLLGMCGASDMRDVVARAEGGDERADLALEVYCYRIRKYVGAYLAVLGRCDAVVFTGGVGEHSAPVRRLALNGLRELGIELDEARNERHETRISTDTSEIDVLVIATDEEGEIARQTAEVADRAGA